MRGNYETKYISEIITVLIRMNNPQNEDAPSLAAMRRSVVQLRASIMQRKFLFRGSVVSMVRP